MNGIANDRKYRDQGKGSGLGTEDLGTGHTRGKFALDGLAFVVQTALPASFGVDVGFNA